MLCSLQDLSSPTGDRTWATAVKAPSPNHWNTREVHKPLFLTTFEELGLTYEDYVQVMRTARTTRKNRYTILDEISYDGVYLKKIYDAVYGGTNGRQ